MYVYVYVAMCICRKCVDCKLAHNNSSDRIWGSIFGLGHCSVRLACWPCRHDLVLFRHSLHFLPSFSVLPQQRPHLRQEKLHLHGRCSLHSRYLINYHIYFLWAMLYIYRSQTFWFTNNIFYFVLSCMPR